MADFDRIIVSVPANATAARVTARGEHWEPAVKSNHTHSEMPLRVAEPQGDMAKAMARQMIGRRSGRLIVIGLAAEQGSPNKKARWVVRCDCGAYEYRKARAINNPRNDDCCTHCEALRIIKRRYQKNGSRPVDEFKTVTGG